MIDIRRSIEEHLAVISEVVHLVPDIERAAERLVACLRAGRKICFAGNGGSAADAQHLAAELVGRFERQRQGLGAIALTTDTSILTAVGNDFGFDKVFSRQVEALCVPGDALVAISTSGNSPNILAAVEVARGMGVLAIGLTGSSGGKLLEAADLCICVPSSRTSRIQEGHCLIGHMICDWIESAMIA